MKNLICFLILAGSLISCTKSHIAITDGDLPEEVFILPNEIKPFTGECLIYYDGTRIIKDRMTYKDGRLHGPMMSYYSNGNMKRKGGFSNGNMHGMWESWYQDGRKKYTAWYVNDTLNGEYVEWYKTGVVKEKGIYAWNKPVGEWIEYDEAGMLIQTEQIQE